MKKNHISALLMLVLTIAISIVSCEKVPYAKSSDCELLEFKFKEHPDADIKRVGSLINVYLPLSVKDLNLTAEFTISDGARSIPETDTLKDFGMTTPIDVISEDNLYRKTYYVSIIYPSTTSNFNSIPLPAQSYKVGETFKIDFASFSSTVNPLQALRPFEGFALSNKTGFDKNNPPSDITSLNYTSSTASAASGNYALCELGYAGGDGATSITFERPINLDTISVSPSGAFLMTMLNGYSQNGYNIQAMGSSPYDFMILVFEGYNTAGELVGTKETYIADFRDTERPYIREGRQDVDFKVSKFKEIKSVKMYVKSFRNVFTPVFAISKISYQVQPELTPKED